MWGSKAPGSHHPATSRGRPAVNWERWTRGSGLASRWGWGGQRSRLSHGASQERKNTKHTRRRADAKCVSVLERIACQALSFVTPPPILQITALHDDTACYTHTSESSPVLVASSSVASPRDELGLGGAVVESENSLSLPVSPPTSMPGGFTRKQ